MRIRMLVLLVALLTWGPANAFATSLYEFDVISGTDHGYSFSWIHAASNKMTVDGVDYYPGGSKLFSIDGVLSAELVGDTLTVLNSVLTATGQGGAFVGDWDLVISGGTLVTDGSGQTSGTLDYELRRPDSTLYDSGTFHIAAETFMGFSGSPNGFDGTTLTLWTNNWDNANMTRDEFIDGGGIALGFDLRAVGRPVPEPTGALLFGLGLVALRRPLRKRSRA